MSLKINKKDNRLSGDCLVRFVKHDAKKIKILNKDRKLADIQNMLSVHFGYRHFNDLNEKSSLISNPNIFKSVSEDNLKLMKEKYKDFLVSNFGFSDVDIGSIGSLLLKYENAPYIYIDNGSVDEFEIDLNDYCLKLNNHELKCWLSGVLLDGIRNSGVDLMWSYWALAILKDIKKMLFIYEGLNVDLQYYLFNFSSFNNFSGYIKKNKIDKDLLMKKYPRIAEMFFFNIDILYEENVNENLSDYRRELERFGYFVYSCFSGADILNLNSRKPLIVMDVFRKTYLKNKDMNIKIYLTKDMNSDAVKRMFVRLLTKPIGFGKRKYKTVFNF